MKMQEFKDIHKYSKMAVQAVYDNRHARSIAESYAEGRDDIDMAVLEERIRSAQDCGVYMYAVASVVFLLALVRAPWTIRKRLKARER